MGQQRTDTSSQLAAKQRVADRRRCPACNRRSALSTPGEIADDYGRRIGRYRKCLYCGHEVGIKNGETFGYRTERVDDGG
jgi:hypothetical protein